MSVVPTPGPPGPAARLLDHELASRTFLLAVSHDLRNPVALLVALTERMRSRAPLSDDDREVLEALTQAVDSIRSVVADLLGAERLAAPDLEVVRRPTDLSTLVARCVHDAAVTSPVVTRLPRASVMVDDGLLERILVNLLVNADRHNEPGGSITVRARSARSRLILTVDDEGPGIDDARKERVFDLFAHGGGAGDGLGVGLHIVRRFAEMHGGGAEALDSPSGGARLRVWLET